MKPINLDRDPVWALYEGLAAEAEEKVRNHYKPSRRFRASEISKCRKQIWYRLSGYIPLPKKPWLEMVAAAGNLYHDYYRYLSHHLDGGIRGVTFNEDGEQHEADNVVRTYTFDDATFDLSCRVDGEQVLPGLDDTAVIEIKTMTTYQFEAMQKAWIKEGNEGAIAWVMENKPEYAWQGNQSAMMMEKSHVYLLCIDRNLNRIGLSDSPLGGKPHTWDPLVGNRAGGAVWEIEESDKINILRKAADVSKAVESGKAPSPEFTSTSKECEQCDFFIYCHGSKRDMTYPIPGVLK